MLFDQTDTRIAGKLPKNLRGALSFINHLSKKITNAFQNNLFEKITHFKYILVQILYAKKRYLAVFVQNVDVLAAAFAL